MRVRRVLRRLLVGSTTESSFDPAPISIPPSPPRRYPKSDLLDQALLVDAARERGLSVKRLSKTLIRISDGSRRLLFCLDMPETTSSVSRSATNDKADTKVLLRRRGLPTPEGAVFRRRSRDEAWSFALSRLPVVVKPAGGTSGKGVTVNVSDRDHFEVAWTYARKAYPRQKIMVERYISGNDYRLFVIGQATRAVMRRWPPCVTGDGVSTIAELIERKNEERSGNPHLRLSAIEVDARTEYNLRGRGLTESSVLESGQLVELHRVHNAAAGSESEDLTDVAHPGFCEIAVRAKRAFPRLTHAGVDILAQDISAAPESQQWTICEVNSRPDPAFHHFPWKGQARDVAGALLEHLFKVPADKK